MIQRSKWSEQQDLNLRRPPGFAQGDSDRGRRGRVTARLKAGRDSDIARPVGRAGAVQFRGARRAVIYDGVMSPDGFALVSWEFVHARDLVLSDGLTEEDAAEIIRQIERGAVR